MKNKIYYYIVLLVAFVGCSSNNITKTEEVEGKWHVSFISKDVGKVNTVFNFETENNKFSAATREDADEDILGWWTSFLGRLFTDDFENGSLLRIENGEIQQNKDTFKLSGIFRSAIGSYYFDGFVYDSILKAELTTKKGTIKGKIRGDKNIPELPLSDYSEIFKKAIKKTEEKIFNPKLLENNEQWNEFLEEMNDVLPYIQDDVEMVFAYFYYAGELPFSHYSLMKIPEEKLDTDEVLDEKQIELKELNTKTAYLDINSFTSSAEEIDSVFTLILNKNYENLVVDLRNNQGGNAEPGMKFASYITDKEFYGGIFLTQKWFNENNNIPEVKNYTNFKTFSEHNYELLLEGIHKEKGLALKVIPNKNNFKGNLFVLTNKNTASTCEPIVYGIKQYNLGKVIGQTTAGSMLNGEKFKIKDGFTLIVPTADYYTADGYRIDGKGVKPDIEVESKDALDKVLEKLIGENK